MGEGAFGKLGDVGAWAEHSAFFISREAELTAIFRAAGRWEIVR